MHLAEHRLFELLLDCTLGVTDSPKAHQDTIAFPAAVPKILRGLCSLLSVALSVQVKPSSCFLARNIVVS